MAYSSSPSSSSRSWKYDVFLSFRGEDTRKTFVDHLYKALNDRLLRTYKDDITLPRGESVGPALLKAIEESGHAVIIFSTNYANSSWCLDELVHIMKCREEIGLTVIPIFYDVEPSEVRYQKRKFGEAFSVQEMKNASKAELWRKALFDAGSISGWEPKKVENGHEAMFIKKIVDAISDNLIPLNSDIDEELVGMRARMQDLISSLEIGSGGVRMVGIWGIGGGGKTTLATSLYMEISRHFGGHCIIENIREESSKHGRTTLQAKILSTLLKTQVVVQSEEEGKRVMKNRLCHSNVLLLLDDVDDRKQLEALAGSHTWFGDGSRIIITTRNEHLLRTHRVDQVSPIKLLSHDEAMQLFTRYAYNEMDPIKDYETISLRVVSYAGGLPLALKVLGSFLYDKDEKEWMSALARLKNIPQSDILKQLRISFDGLETTEKEIFLDIVCFFMGGGRLSREDAIEILDACGFHPHIGIKVLIQKALITINSKGEFDMHDLIQEMGHFIVRGEHPDNPEKHSRVWKKEEIRNMCIRDATTENDKIEAMRYDKCPNVRPSHFFKFVSNLKKLRWIHVGMNNIFLDDRPNFLSNELRYINWYHYPATPFPDSFQPMNLVILKMSRSCQKKLWRSHKRLPQLKVLQLHDSEIVSTPNFDELPCLQELELNDCCNLEEIHPSIGNHRSLKKVQVSACRNLRMFPTIFKMEKLELIDIRRCHESLKFPEIQANMESLVDLSLSRIGIEGLLSSIGERCTSLISLHLSYCFKIKSIEIDFNGLKHHLQRLDLVGCRLEDGEIPSAVGQMSNLKELNLYYNNFSKLNFSISQLTRLRRLNLSYCKKLLELPQLPSNIAILLANKCDSLTDVGDFYVDCKRLRYVSLVCSNMVIDGNRLLQNMLEGENAENHCLTLKLEGLEIPKGFTHCLNVNKKCTVQLPENWCSDFCGFLLCAVLRNDFTAFSSQSITMRQEIPGGSMGTDSEDDDVIWKESVDDKITWVWYIPFDTLRHTRWWDSTHKKVTFSISSFYKGCSGYGVRLVDRKGGRGPTETSAAQISTNISSGISDENDDYTPRFKIIGDSKNYLMIDPQWNRYKSN